VSVGRDRVAYPSFEVNDRPPLAEKLLDLDQDCRAVQAVVRGQ